MPLHVKLTACFSYTGFVDYITLLGSFLKDMASFDEDQRQDTVSHICKLYTSASIRAFTAYNLYPRDASATKGFALLFVRALALQEPMPSYTLLNTCTAVMALAALLAGQLSMTAPIARLAAASQASVQACCVHPVILTVQFGPGPLNLYVTAQTELPTDQ